MKLLTALLFLFLALPALSTEACLTHGQCDQKKEIACFKVLTGIDPMNHPTCRTMCKEVALSGHCKKIPGKAYGFCVREKLPVFGPIEEGCSDAIPAEVFDPGQSS